MKSLSFSDALLLLNAGNKMARTGWNGKDMFIFLVQGSTFKVNRPPLNVLYEEGTEITYLPHIDMKTVDGSVGTWSATNADLLTEDWVIVL